MEHNTHKCNLFKYLSLLSPSKIFTAIEYLHSICILNTKQNDKSHTLQSTAKYPLTPRYHFNSDFHANYNYNYHVIAITLTIIVVLIFLLFITQKCLQCFDAVGWAAGRAPFIQFGFVLLPKSTRPVKTESCGAGTVICLERGADLHTAQLMPLPLTVSCSSKIQIGFTFLVPTHPGSPGQRAVKRVCVITQKHTT